MNQVIKTILFFLMMILPFTNYAQLKSYSFEEIDSLQKVETKNIVVFVHTDWCKFCQAMKNTTFKDHQLMNQLNEKYWYISLNAEEKSDIKFQNHTFRFKPTGNNTGIHELAEQLATVNGEIAFPTICIINSKNEMIFQYNQFLTAADLLSILTKTL